MKFINKKMLVVINALALGLCGSKGQSVIRDGQSLGFVERIYSNEVFGAKIYPDIFHQAAAYLFYIIKNHTFYDGNKRTGLAAAITFLEWNQIKFAPLDEDSVFNFVVAIAAGDNDPEQVIPRIAAWIKEMSLY